MKVKENSTNWIRWISGTPRFGHVHSGRPLVCILGSLSFRGHRLDRDSDRGVLGHVVGSSIRRLCADYSGEYV